MKFTKLTLCITFLAALVSFNHCVGQNRALDSLNLILKTSGEDTNKVKTLNNLSWLLKQDNLDSAIAINSRALELAQKLKWQKGVAGSCRKLGVYNWLKGNYPDALQYYFRALKINEEENDKEGIFATCQNIAIVYNDIKEIKKALEYYSKALALAEELNDKNKIGLTFGNMAGLYQTNKEFSKALEFYEKALKIEEELGNKSEIAREIGNIANIYSSQKNYPKALEYALKAVKMFEDIGDQWSVAVNNGNIGMIYTKTRDFKRSEEYLQKALNFSVKMQALDFITDYELSLSEMFEESGQAVKALHHYKNYIMARDSVFNAANTKKETESEMNFAFEKTRALAAAEQEKKDALAAEAMKQQRQQRNYFIAGFILMLAFAFFILISYRQKQKANIELASKNNLIEKQKKLVDDKQKEILDSIRYAKRIQSAMLTSEKYFGKNLGRLKKDSSKD